jgi:hypothetical protein
MPHMDRHTFVTNEPARLRACVVEELATAAEALRDAVEFARTGVREPDACAHYALGAIASIRWAGDLLDQLGGRLVDPDDLLSGAAPPPPRTS